MTQLKDTEETPLIPPPPAVKKIIPGAPPPVEKTPKKKKNKTKSKAVNDPSLPTEKDGEAEVTEVVHEPTSAVAALVPAVPIIGEKKSSPAVDSIHKRIRNFNKKIQRAKEYQSKSPESLNDDQRKVIASLPSLEAVVHELEDFKKTIEPLELQHSREISSQASEVVRLAVAKANEEFETSKSDRDSKFLSVLALLRPDNVWSDSEEHVAASSCAKSLTSVSTSNTDKLNLLQNLLSGTGEWEGVSCTEILAVADQQLAPESGAAEVDLVQEEVNGVVGEIPEEDPLNEQPTEPEVPVINAEAPPPTGTAFHFMQESELEASLQQPDATDGDEVVNGSPVVNEEEFVVVNEQPQHVQHSMNEPIAVDATTAQGPLDWAAEDNEHELPSINALHAKFGTSGDVTPEPEPEVAAAAGSEIPQVSLPTPTPAPATKHEADGFTPVAKRGGDRDGQGGFRGFRGAGDRGGGRGRGGFRGRGWRGDDRGRGRGSFRGADRGFRGGRGRAIPEPISQ